MSVRCGATFNTTSLTIIGGALTCRWTRTRRSLERSRRRAMAGSLPSRTSAVCTTIANVAPPDDRPARPLQLRSAVVVRPRSPRHESNDSARRPNVALPPDQPQLDGAGPGESRGVENTAMENARRMECSVGTGTETACSDHPTAQQCGGSAPAGRDRWRILLVRTGGALQPNEVRAHVFDERRTA
jgi:hypothetical protein